MREADREEEGADRAGFWDPRLFSSTLTAPGPYVPEPPLALHGPLCLQVADLAAQQVQSSPVHPYAPTSLHQFCDFHGTPPLAPWRRRCWCSSASHPTTRQASSTTSSSASGGAASSAGVASGAGPASSTARHRCCASSASGATIVTLPSGEKEKLLCNHIW